MQFHSFLSRYGANYLISGDPRTIDQVVILGPATTSSGSRAFANRISSNPCNSSGEEKNGNHIQYVTWDNSDPLGEYLLWSFEPSQTPGRIALSIQQRQKQVYFISFTSF